MKDKTSVLDVEAVALRPTKKGLQLIAVLQSTLDVEQLITLFHRETKDVLTYDNISYLIPHNGLELNLGTGKPAKQSCCCNLTLDNHSLGQITFTRGEEFTPADRKLIESLLGSLAYPLRNALEYKKVAEDATRDPLTGAYNRGVMEAALTREVALAKRHKLPLSFLMIDIDHFKNVNDTYGHATGDHVLNAFTNCIAQHIRTTDILFRYGGEEFTVLLNNTPLQGALILAERIRRAAERGECVADNGEKISITASIGVACLGEGDTEQDLFNHADKALYMAKEHGRNCIRYLQ